MLPDQSIPSTSTSSSLDAVCLRAIAYGDVFDYPLTAVEIHRYLPEAKASMKEIQSLLENNPFIANHVQRAGEFWTLKGRESLIDIRREREQKANLLWPVAVHFAGVIGRLPFTRMVGITGALAVNNEPGIDIDYLIVTKPGRLWLNRLLVIATVRWAAQRGISLCPNYFLSERALVFSERNLYTAHELCQMIPLYGSTVYQRIRHLNRWTESFLPNAKGPPPSPNTNDGQLSTDWLKLIGEFSLQTPPGRWIEHWEMERKIRKFQGNPAQREASFSSDFCKGHFSGHGQRILNEYIARLCSLESPSTAG